MAGAALKTGLEMTGLVKEVKVPRPGAGSRVLYLVPIPKNFSVQNPREQQVAIELGEILLAEATLLSFTREGDLLLKPHCELLAGTGAAQQEPLSGRYVKFALH